MNEYNIQTTPATFGDQHHFSNIFEKEPFLLQEMTLNEFKEYVLMDNDEISIDDVNFNPSRITV